jgi:hypothetical protein
MRLISLPHNVLFSFSAACTSSAKSASFYSWGRILTCTSIDIYIYMDLL